MFSYTSSAILLYKEGIKLEPANWLWLLPILPAVSVIVLRVGAARSWPVLWLLPTVYSSSQTTWFTFVIAAYIYGFRDPRSLAPFLVTLLVSILAGVTLQILAWYHVDKPAPVTVKIPPKLNFALMAISVEFPLVILALAFLANGGYDWRLVVYGFVTLQAVLGVTFYAVWDKMKQNPNSGELR